MSAKPARGAAAEAVSIHINEGPLRRRARPFVVTYLGESVVNLAGVGVFAKHVTAEVDAATAAKLEGDPAWRVERRQRP